MSGIRSALDLQGHFSVMFAFFIGRMDLTWGRSGVVDAPPSGIGRVGGGGVGTKGLRCDDVNAGVCMAAPS